MSKIQQLLGRVLSKFIHIEHFYFCTGKKGEVPLTGRNLRKEELIAFYKKHDIYPAKMISLYEKNFDSEHKTPYAIFVNNDCASLGWYSKSSLNEIPPSVKGKFKAYYTISDCVTASAFRGKGLYSKIINEVTGLFDTSSAVLICVYFWNKSSVKGIEKSNMTFLATRLVIFKKTFWL